VINVRPQAAERLSYRPPMRSIFRLLCFTAHGFFNMLSFAWIVTGSDALLASSLSSQSFTAVLPLASARGLHGPSDCYKSVLMWH